MNVFTFDETTREFILAVFNKGVDEESYIYDLESGERVLSPDGDEVLLKDFAGIRKGSEIMIKNDLPSLLEYASDAAAE